MTKYFKKIFKMKVLNHLLSSEYQEIKTIHPEV